eukprot:CAMPEP_0182577154 /NCGR_PEP_ID=MMETSP1324-20130603/36400_1 /TAXON_ID=236786 /ORGANISM="Florenciella sp., Strain RCC1587" /LENGTH=62 /DNA_ID=CAMNT_0024792925 /DNA_START=89 /DNA_END=277 /DNA_ORIENTATION=-
MALLPEVSWPPSCCCAVSGGDSAGVGRAGTCVAETGTHPYSVPFPSREVEHRSGREACLASP